MASPGTPTDDIDTLLERYLGLLDEYTKLRSSLTDLQSRIYQNIARANFSAERGVRYGQDLYDQRMQSSRALVISNGDNNTPSFKIVPRTGVDQDAGGDEEKEKSAERPRDPLRWFGILTPMPLRQAQSQAVEAVEEIIPKLVSVNAEMADVEIQVRRARKKRAKAEAAAEKEQQEGQKGGIDETVALPSSNEIMA
jgi:hypothetical protein